MAEDSEEPSLVEECASLMLDFVPVVGSGKSVIELIGGKDVITGQEINRWLAGGGIILGVIPFGKLLTKGAKTARMAEAVGAKIACGSRGKQELIKKIEAFAPTGTKEAERSFILQEIRAAVRPDATKAKFPNPLDFKSDISLVEQSPARLLYGGHAIQKHWVSGGKKELLEHLSQAEGRKIPSGLTDADDVFEYLQLVLSDPKTVKMRLPIGNRVAFANNEKKVLVIHNAEKAGTFYHEPKPTKALNQLYKKEAERLLTPGNIAKYQVEQQVIDEMRDVLQKGMDRGYQHSSIWNSSYWTRFTNFNGNRVYQKNTWIDPLRVSEEGKTSLQLMRKGSAPIGPDGMPIELHHLLQMQEGAIAEVTHTFHKQNSYPIHMNQPAKDFPSGIDRPTFKLWKDKYWKYRAKDFE